MGGADANLLNANYFGADGKALGATGGAQSHTSYPWRIADWDYVRRRDIRNGQCGWRCHHYAGGSGVLVDVLGGAAGGTAPQVGTASRTNSLTVMGTASVTSNNTGGSPHAVVQPSIIANKILRIIWWYLP